MSGLLREALKSLCGVSQWCYVIFWKIGCQNTKLLIWEDCYYDPAPSSSVPPCISGFHNPELPFGEQGSETSSYIGSHSWHKVDLLINKVMNTRINIVGQGLVGRAAFTGNHQWILANNYITDGHPPEVLNEVHLQFSAGMQTVAVIPVLPHGVVQLGSSTAIMENMGFINEVKSLILHLGCIPGALLSNSYGTNVSIEKIGIPISLGKPISKDAAEIYKPTSSMASVTEGYNQQSNSSQASKVIGQSPSLIKQIQQNSQGSASTSQLPGLTQSLAKSHHDHFESKIYPEMKPNLHLKSQMDCGVVGAEVISSNPTVWMEPQASFCNSQPVFNCQPIIGQSIASHSSIRTLEQQIMSGAGLHNHVINSISASNSQMKPKSIAGFVSSIDKGEDDTSYMQLLGSGVQKVGSSGLEVPLSVLANQLTSARMLTGVSNRGCDSVDSKCTQPDLVPKKESMDNALFQALLHADNVIPLCEQVPIVITDCLKHESERSSTRSLNAKYENACLQPPSGDDLFDVLGADLKSKILNRKWNDVLAEGPDRKMQNLGKDNSTFRDMHNVFYYDNFSANDGISDQGLYTGVGTDHLLDAVVSSAHSAGKQISDDTVSCKTTLTKFSNSSIPISSPSIGQVNIPDQVQRELVGSLPKSLLKRGTLPSSSYRSDSKDDAGTSSQTNVNGCQVSSWVEQGQNTRRDSSVSTAYSKRNDEMTKPNRKRLKPGENPRPRPKDRQMIQDRVKELREIVPNGAKCSIDALLERAIKHMLFLQSVTKHADKLKQTGESKMKENFEGGTTWAFEVGSQSMICPIVVEDLNPPRQMLVEMLCEERGFFLEIADLIRGLGLTILKGVMETRNDKIWARFAVEANRDVTRVEIFMSLVQLLEQTVKGSTSAANASGTNNIMVQHSFPQAASIPATGRVSSLQ